MLRVDQRGELEVHVFIGRNERTLDKNFFSTNLGSHDGFKCKKCGKLELGRYERVDVEFWENDVETLCLNCWGGEG